VDSVPRAVGAFPTEGGTLVVSGFEQGGDPIVTRHQFFELYGADGRLVWKRLLRMEFNLIGRGFFETMANSVGFRVVQLYGNYDRTPFDPITSPFMIWVLERGRQR
jgi:hypothetical protein